MTANAHTPGPWQAIKLSKYRTSIDTLDMTPVCNLEEATPADARLIAAAPDMLAALDLAVTEADHAHDCEFEMAMRHHYARLKWIRPNATRQYAKKSAELDATRPDAPCTCWLSKCVEAIAKARGLQ